MAIVTLPNIGGGSDPATINVSVLNGKVDPLATDYNGNIQNVNIAAGAGIVYTKLTLTDSVVNADINSSAAIAASKLDLSSIAQNLVMTSKIIKQAKGADVASVAGAMTLGDDGNYFDITGTEAITSITAKAAGTVVTLQFDSTASLVDGSNLKLQGNFTGAAEAQITLVSDGTNWFEVSRNTFSYTPTASNALSGSVVQTVTTNYATYAGLGSTAMPLDDSIPQNDEGNAISMDTAITPTNSSNTLIIDVLVFISTSANAVESILALFQDSTAGALASAVALGSQVSPVPMRLRWKMAAGTTSATTFKLRVGDNGGGANHINGSADAGARKLGGSLVSSIVIQEIKA